MTIEAGADEGPAGPEGVVIRHGARPGDLSMVVQQHGRLYAAELGFGATFEPYVAQPMSDFIEALAAKGDRAGRLWIAEDAGSGAFAGTIAIGRPSDGATSDREIAQMSWFLLAMEQRGKGLGGRLIDEAIAFSRAAGLSAIDLWTLEELSPALGLYGSRRFRQAERSPADLWGRKRVQLRLRRSYVGQDRADGK